MPIINPLCIIIKKINFHVLLRNCLSTRPDTNYAGGAVIVAADGTDAWEAFLNAVICITLVVPQMATPAATKYAQLNPNTLHDEFP
jgi:hypothetical protein